MKFQNKSFSHRTFLILPLLFVLSGCGKEAADRHEAGVDGSLGTNPVSHESHEMLRNRVAHRGIVVLDDIYKTTPATRHSMARILDEYAYLRDSLVEGEIGKVDSTAQSMLAAVEAVPTGDLRREGREAWEQHASLYSRTLRELAHATSLKEKRSYFAHISEIVYCSVKSFGLGDKLSNVYFCPMAFDSKGAYWLSDIEYVQNPYFGKSMINCGERVEVLGP
jgi:hypothetical protein